MFNRSSLRLYSRAVLCVLGAAWCLHGCSLDRGNNRFIDSRWHHQDLDSHLSRWLAVAPTPSGLFLWRIDREWHPIAAPVGDLTMQSRLIFAMARGYEITGDKRYLDEAVRGTDFLLDRLHDPVHGGFFNSVAADGKVISSDKRSYGHAFALLALSHVARITGDEKYLAAAMNAWHEIKRNLRDPHGGFCLQASRDFTPSNGARSQNSTMHMFEALLALIDATRDAGVIADARSVGDFVLYKLLEGQSDGGAFIPEKYDEHWKPLASREKGGYIDIGHQFEWSHLLAGAESRGLPALYALVGERLLKYALKNGYDEIDGGVFNLVYPDGSIDREKYWWQQAEGLRALMVAAASTDRGELKRRYQQTLDLVRNQLVDTVHGGWKSGVDKGCTSSRCTAEQPDPYHMVGMHVTALRLAENAR